MLRQTFTDRLRTALKARDARTVSTSRLILAALRDRYAGAIDFSQAAALVRRLLPDRSK
jgi:uncharacterized protein YqeY